MIEFLMSTPLCNLYPEIAQYQHGHLEVSALHSLYYEQCGHPNGQPVVFLHGGPGSGCNPGQRRFFDPAHYRIILLDQRGCGRSKPLGCIEENTTAELVADIEHLRRHLGIEPTVEDRHRRQPSLGRLSRLHIGGQSEAVGEPEGLPLMTGQIDRPAILARDRDDPAFGTDRFQPVAQRRGLQLVRPHRPVVGDRLRRKRQDTRDHAPHCLLESRDRHSPLADSRRHFHQQSRA